MCKKTHGNKQQWLLDRHRSALHSLENEVSGARGPPASSLDKGIRVYELFDHQPEELPGAPDKEGRRFYFTPRARKRSSEFGRWRANDGKQEIRDLEGRRPIGFAQHLIYMQGRERTKETRTRWAMIKYTLAPHRIPLRVDELSHCVIYKTRDYKKKAKASCRENPKAKMMDDAGPSEQAVNKVADPTDDLIPLPDEIASMDFPMDPSMLIENHPFYEDLLRRDGYLGPTPHGFNEDDWSDFENSLRTLTSIMKLLLQLEFPDDQSVTS